MTTLELEKRLTALEAEVVSLKQQTTTNKPTAALPSSIPWWQEISGAFKDDPIFDEAMRLGREWRESQREDYDTDEHSEQEDTHGSA